MIHGKSYSIAEHLNKTDENCRILFRLLQTRILELYPSTAVNPVKILVGFRSKLNFAEVHFQAHRLKIHLRPCEYVDPLNKTEMVDDHYITMRRRFYVERLDEIDYAIGIIKQSLADSLR